MPYRVEFGIPIPKAWNENGERVECPYPFAEMSIGASFLITEPNLKMQRAKVMRWASTYRKREGNPGFYVTTRIRAEGLRVWRVARAAPEPATLSEELQSAVKHTRKRVMNGGVRR